MSQTEKLLVWGAAASATLNRKIRLILLLSVLCEKHTYTYAHTPKMYSLACYNQLTKQTYWKMWSRRAFNRTITAQTMCLCICLHDLSRLDASVVCRYFLYRYCYCYGSSSPLLFFLLIFFLLPLRARSLSLTHSLHHTECGCNWKPISSNNIIHLA